jgi:hypothetical protein
MTRTEEIKKRLDGTTLDPRDWFAQRARESFITNAPADIEWLLRENTRLRDELVTDEALGYAQRLAKQLLDELEPGNTTFEVLDDTLGVLTQIDNITTGFAPLSNPLDALTHTTKGAKALRDAGYMHRSELVPAVLAFEQRRFNGSPAEEEVAFQNMVAARESIQALNDAAALEPDPAPDLVEAAEDVLAYATSAASQLRPEATRFSGNFSVKIEALRNALANTPEPPTDEDYCYHEAPLNEMDCCPVCDAQFLPKETRT